MAHGAGRLARKTAALAGAAAIQAARRSRSGAEEDNAAVEAMHSGAAAAQAVARHSVPHPKTDRSSKRDANLRKRALRREENVRSDRAQKKGTHPLFPEKEASTRDCRGPAKRAVHRHSGRICRLGKQRVHRAEEGKGSREVLLFRA